MSRRQTDNDEYYRKKMQHRMEIVPALITVSLILLALSSCAHMFGWL